MDGQVQETGTPVPLEQEDTQEFLPVAQDPEEEEA